MDEARETSHVLAADYRVPDVDRLRAKLHQDRAGIRRLGARHILVYRALDDPDRLFVTIGVHHRGPLERLLRSGVILDWYDAIGVEEIPPLFAGDVVERIDLVRGEPAADPAGHPGHPGHPGVVVAAVAPVADARAFVARVHSDLRAFRAAGVRKVWLYQAVDDGHEVMVLQEVDSLAHARQWLRRADALGEWLSGTGVGVYPPLFVGGLVEAIHDNADRFDAPGES